MAKKVWADFGRTDTWNIHEDFVYGAQHGYVVIEVHPETLARWRRVQSEFQAVTEEIRNEFAAATHKEGATP